MSSSALLEHRQIYAGHDYPVQTVAFSPDGSTVVTGDTGMNLRVWQAGEEALAMSLHEEWDKVRPTERIRGAAFSRTGDRLFVAAGQHLAAFDLMEGAKQVVPEWDYVAPRAFAFLIVSPIGLTVSRLDQVAAAFDNGTIGVWPTNGASRKIWHDNSSPRMLAYLHDGVRIAGTDSFSVCVWDSAASKRLSRMKFRDRIYGFAASPVDDIVAVRTLEATKIVRLADSEVIGEAAAATGLPLLAFSPSGKTIAMGSRNAIDLLNLDGSPRGQIPLLDTRLVSMAISPDGDRIAGGCADGTVRFWPLD